MANVTVVLHRPEIANLVSWNGQVGAAVGRLAAETVALQKVYAPKKTGKLAASVRFSRKRYARGIGFEAGSTVKYALYQETGTPPHIIRAKRAGMLTFFWPKVGHVVHFRSVRHPGNPGTHFLERGMDHAIRAWSG
jgi:hypothetical protein